MSGTSDPASSELGGARRPFLRHVLMSVALAFVGYTAWALYRTWKPGPLDVTVWLAVVSVLPLLVGVLLQAWGWVRLARRMSGLPVALAAGLRLYLDSHLARYAPGKIGLPIVRMEGGARLGLNATLVGSSILVETLCWAAVGSVVSMLVLAGLGHQRAAMFALLGRHALPLSFLFSLGLVLLVFVDRRRLPAFALRLLKLGENGPLVPVDLPLIHVGVWVTWGMHGYLVSRAIGAAPEDATSAVGAFLVAQIAGFLIVAAPAGLGVREALLSLALAPSVGSVGALAAAVLSRILTLAAEVLCWAALRAAPAVAPDHPQGQVRSRGGSG